MFTSGMNFQTSKTITQNQREKRRTSLSQVWGEETDPILLSTIPGDYRNPLVSSLRPQPAETWCPNQGSCDPRCRVWGGGVTLETVEVCPQVQALGTVWVSPHPRGSGSCAHGDHMSALYLQCVLSPQRFPASELRVLS